MKLVRFSSENYVNDRRAIYAIDASPRTLWHSRFFKELAEHPRKALSSHMSLTRHPVEGR